MADLPAFEAEDIDSRITDHTLHIEAEHKAEEEFGDEGFIRPERAWTEVTGTIPSPR